MNSLTPIGSTLYGMTSGGGGSSGLGTIFKLNLDGTGYATLHSFTGGSNNGGTAYGSLTQVGSTLYGVTAFGGSADMGIVFKINTDGSGFSLLHSFSGGAGGGFPMGSLTLSGSTLYGTTAGDGVYKGSTVFSINLDGTGFDVLHTFQNVSVDGNHPVAGLTLVGSTLYGTTAGGGNADFGTIFKLNLDGSGYSQIHSFLGTSDGQAPYGALLQIGSTFYGTTRNGGSDGLGNIFKLNDDGSGFSVVYEFATSTGSGGVPIAGLTQVGSSLYGTTEGGPGGVSPCVFKLNTDGTGFSIIEQQFITSGPLVQVDAKLYGMTFSGGNFNQGTVYSVPVPEPSAYAFVGLGVLVLLWRVGATKLKGA